VWRREIELQAGDGEHRHVPRLQRLQRLHEVDGAAAPAGQPVTRIASISRAWASAITFLRSARSFLAPEAFSL